MKAVDCVDGCRDGYLQCHDGPSVCQEKRCNGVHDCAQGEDEIGKAGFMKMVPSVYTLLLNTSYLSHSTQVAFSGGTRYYEEYSLIEHTPFNGGPYIE